MLIGAMNHPKEDPVEEIGWMANLGFDFVDLTLEPPRPAPWLVDTGAIRAAIQNHKLSVVGHTAYYLPFASPFEDIRQAAVSAMRRCIDAFAAIGVRWINLHPDPHAPMHDRDFIVRQNLSSFSELIEFAKERGASLMLENIPGPFNSAEQLAELLDPLPELGLHLDIGHANLQVTKNTAREILARFGDRLRHVHLHDNRGGNADLHLPLGCGTVNTPEIVRLLKEARYDGTITLEVFTPDRRHLTYSRDVLRELWDRGGDKKAS